MNNLNKTSLYEKHQKLEAKLVDFAGFEMPIMYQNLKDEVKAVRSHVGVFDVSHMGEFFIEGPQAIEAVDYLVTNNISKAELNKAIYSPMCNLDGGIIDDLIVYKLDQSKVMICVNAANIEKDFKWMTENIKNFDVTMRNNSSDYSLIAIQGPKSFEVLSQTSFASIIKDIDYYSAYSSQYRDSNIIIARTGYTGEDGFEVFINSKELTSTLWDELLENGAKPCGLGSRDVLRTEVCYPLYGNELSDDISPLEAGLKWTVDLSKQNFIGKEALLTRQANSKLIKLVLEKGIPRAGYNVLNTNGEIVGVISSGTMSVTLEKGIALARINNENVEDEYIVSIRNKNYVAKRSKKPFVSGGHK